MFAPIASLSFTCCRECERPGQRDSKRRVSLSLVAASTSGGRTFEKEKKNGLDSRRPFSAADLSSSLHLFRTSDPLLHDIPNRALAPKDREVPDRLEATEKKRVVRGDRDAQFCWVERSSTQAGCSIYLRNSRAREEYPLQHWRERIIERDRERERNRECDRVRKSSDPSSPSIGGCTACCNTYHTMSGTSLPSG